MEELLCARTNISTSVRKDFEMYRIHGDSWTFCEIEELLNFSSKRNLGIYSSLFRNIKIIRDIYENDIAEKQR